MVPHENRIESLETPLVLFSTPETLLTMASSQAALTCWHSGFFDRFCGHKDYLTSEWFIKQMSNNENDVNVEDDTKRPPKPILDLLDYNIKLMNEELENWWARHSACFDVKSFYTVIRLNKHFVLDPNGRVCFTTTARNLLTCPDGCLNRGEKYRIACMYCLEDDIRQLWPKVSTKRKVLNWFFEDEPIFVYWNSVMKNELDQIPGDMRVPVEERMLSHEYIKKWFQVGYFWNKLNAQQRTSQVNSLLTKNSLVKYLLPRLNEDQLENALRNMAPGIFNALARKRDSCHFVLQVWEYMKSSTCGDQFYSILRNLIELGFSEWNHKVAHVSVLLYELWTSTPNHLKQYVLNRHVERIFDDICHLDKKCSMHWYGRDVRFFLNLLRNVKFDLRKQIWRKYYRRLILIAKPEDLEWFMKLCFRNENAIAQFKERFMMNYKTLMKQFDKFIEEGMCDELIDYLKFCSTDEERVRTVMKQIVDASITEMHTLDPNSIEKFDSFIDRTFTSAELAQQFKEEFIRQNFDKLYEILDDGDFLDGLSTLIDCFLPAQSDHVIVIKRKFYQRCQNNLASGIFLKFCIPEWQDFLEWCAPSLTEMYSFKRALPVHDIFDNILNNVIRGHISSRSRSLVNGLFIRSIASAYTNRLRPIDDFLEWCFNSREKALKFKFNKIENYEQNETISKMFVEQTNEISSIVLSWFFDGDEVKIAEFCSRKKIPGFDFVGA